MLTPTLEKIEAKGNNCLLSSRVQTKNASRIFLRAVAIQRQYLKTVTESEKARNSLDEFALIGSLQENKNESYKLTFSHGVGLICAKIRAKLCTVNSKQIFLFIFAILSFSLFDLQMLFCVPFEVARFASDINTSIFFFSENSTNQ